MKILMVNPPIYDFAAYDFWMKPAGFLKLADLFKKNGFEIYYFDFLDRTHPIYREKEIKDRKYGCGKFYSIDVEKPEIYKDVPRRYRRFGLPPEIFISFLRDVKNIDFIFITTGMTYWYLGVEEVVSMCRKIFPGIPQVIGGIYATFCSEHAAENLGVEMIFKGKNLEDFIREFNSMFSMDLKFYEDIYPDWTLYRNLKYLCIRTSYGCPFSCYYCGIKQLQPCFSQRDIKDVFYEVMRNYERFRFQDIAFYDDALLFNFENHLLKFLEIIEKNNLKFNFHTPNGLHPKFISRKVSGVLKKSGFKTIRLSLETITSERMEESSFKVSFEEFERAINNLVLSGFKKEEIGVYILAGLPDQRYEEVKSTIKILKKFPCKINLAEYSPIPGTVNYEISRKLYPSLPLENPLFQNNSIFPLWNFPDKWEKIEELKDLAHS